MTRSLLIVILLSLVYTFSSCDNKKKRKTLSEMKAYEKPLEDVNKYLLKKDETTIRNHCKRREWDMQMKPSGLWYGCLKSSNGDSVKTGDYIEIRYKVSLLDGTVLYDSEKLGNKSFTVGHSVEESGLEEGVLLMKNKEKYRFILPPYKAHGLLGDLEKIPARTIIVYEVEIVDINS
jgi:FKBP-type peptidyl-prolyl cis-trans isomerase